MILHHLWQSNQETLEDKRTINWLIHMVWQYVVECDLVVVTLFGLRYNIVRLYCISIPSEYRYRNVIEYSFKTLNNIYLCMVMENRLCISDIKYYMEPFDILLNEHGDLLIVDSFKFNIRQKVHSSN